MRELRPRPDVLLLDATGRHHPRRAGLALHLGIVLDLPTIGVTHRPLVAEGARPDETGAGAASPLLLDGEAVGVWLRTAPRVRPLAVHPGWRTDADVAATRRCCASVAAAGNGSARSPMSCDRRTHRAGACTSTI